MNRMQQQSGQALAALLAFMATGLIITAAATTVTVVNIQAGAHYALAEEALQLAETGMDNALLRLTRSPSYTGETLTISTGTATITVSGSSPYTIVSQGDVGDFRRSIQVTASRTNNALSVTSWTEEP